jgi:hypothetical protein
MNRKTVDVVLLNARARTSFPGKYPGGHSRVKDSDDCGRESPPQVRNAMKCKENQRGALLFGVYPMKRSFALSRT